MAIISVSWPLKNDHFNAYDFGNFVLISKAEIIFCSFPELYMILMLLSWASMKYQLARCNTFF